MLQRTPTRWTRPTRRAPPGFILPAQPVLALKPPIGPGWLFAVKHDGFRIVARKDGESVHLRSRNGRDWSVEFSGITAALKAWKIKSFVLDGEACACDESGWPDFNALLGGGEPCARACFFAFDLLELDSTDFRPLPFSERYARLARLLASAPEAISSTLRTTTGLPYSSTRAAWGWKASSPRKKKAAHYRSGTCRSWVKVKNPAYERVRSP